MEPPAQIGCYETWSSAFFSKESILLWSITMHRKVRQYYEEAMKRGHIRAGRPLHYVRLRGWGSQLKEWLVGVDELKKGL